MKFNALVKLYESIQPDIPDIRPHQGRDGWFTDKYTNTQRHYVNGMINSVDDKPAVVHEDGDTIWYKDDKIHRDNGPAYISPRIGYKGWYKNGKRHREDGPAIINPTGAGDGTWWLDNVCLSKEQVEERKKKVAITKEIQGHKNNRIDPGMLEDYL